MKTQEDIEFLALTIAACVIGIALCIAFAIAAQWAKGGAA